MKVFGFFLWQRAGWKGGGRGGKLKRGASCFKSGNVANQKKGSQKPNRDRKSGVKEWRTNRWQEFKGWKKSRKREARGAEIQGAVNQGVA